MTSIRVNPTRLKTVAYWGLTGLLLLVTLGLLRSAPLVESMGPVQKLFYLHFPAALNTFLACAIVFVASVGYVWQRRLWWDDLAVAAAKVVVLFCGVVLFTGMIWARSEWGSWWLWSPRLTFSLVLFLLYVGYLLLRLAFASPHQRAMVSAVYGLVAFLDVPLVYLSVRLMPDVHPTSITLLPGMQTVLLAWMLPLTLLMAGLIRTRYTLNRRLRSMAARTPVAMGATA